MRESELFIQSEMCDAHIARSVLVSCVFLWTEVFPVHTAARPYVHDVSPIRARVNGT